MLKMRRTLGTCALIGVLLVGFFVVAPSCQIENQSEDKTKITNTDKPNQYKCPAFGTLFFSKVFDIAHGRDKEITALSTLAIALFTIILAVASGAQFCAVMASIREARRSAIIQTQLTRKSLDLAREEFISTHRPKIIVYGVDFGGSSNEDERPIPVTFRYVNSGVSTAYVTEIGSRVLHLVNKVALPNDVQFRLAQIPFPIEVKSGMHGFGITIDKMTPWSPRALNALVGKESVVCVGYLVYEDDNGTKRQTGFCREYDPSSKRWKSVKDDDYEYSY
jgi:hypothetical protein